MKGVCLSAIFIFCCCFLSAQKFTISVDGQMSLPQGEYKEVNSDAGLGIRANFLYRPKPQIPVKFGIELGMQVKGSTNQYFTDYYYLRDYRVAASNNIISLGIMGRFQPLKMHKIKPFIDVIGGWNVFFSTVNVDDVTYYNDPYSLSYSNSSKARWAFNFGGAAGVDIPLNKRDALGLEVKVAYLLGSNTKYLTDPFITNDGQVSFAENESETNMIIPQIGLRIDIR